MYKSLMTYFTDEPRWVALKLKLGFVLMMKDIFVKPQLLADVSGMCYFEKSVYLLDDSISSIVFLAFANRMALFFSTNFLVVQCSKRWCNGIINDAMATNPSSIST